MTPNKAAQLCYLFYSGMKRSDSSEYSWLISILIRSLSLTVLFVYVIADSPSAHLNRSLIRCSNCFRNCCNFSRLFFSFKSIFCVMLIYCVNLRHHTLASFMHLLSNLGRVIFCCVFRFLYFHFPMFLHLRSLYILMFCYSPFFYCRRLPPVTAH